MKQTSDQLALNRSRQTWKAAVEPKKKVYPGIMAKKSGGLLEVGKLYQNLTQLAKRLMRGVGVVSFD